MFALNMLLEAMGKSERINHVRHGCIHDTVILVVAVRLLFRCFALCKVCL